MNKKSQLFNRGFIKQKKALWEDKVRKFMDKKVLILGDVGLDEYVQGRVSRLSPEAPVPVLNVISREQKVGLAGNVAQNVKSLGGQPFLLGVIGCDRNAETLREALGAMDVDDQYLIQDSLRPTTIKTRFMSGPHHIVRVDEELKNLIEDSVRHELEKKVEKILPQVDIVIFEDYGKGVLSESLCQLVIKRARDMGKQVLLDPNPTTPLSFFDGVSLSTPNEKEAIEMSALPKDFTQEGDVFLKQVAQVLKSKLNSPNLVITRGKDGMNIYSDDEVANIPTFARQVYDVTGAGDTVIATLSMALASGCTLEEACILSNFAAGIAVSQVGCVACSKEDLLNYIHQF